MTLEDSPRPTQNKGPSGTVSGVVRSSRTISGCLGSSSFVTDDLGPPCVWSRSGMVRWDVVTCNLV